MVKSVFQEVVDRNNANVKFLINRSQDLSDKDVMLQLLNDPMLRFNAQAVLEVMYRIRHTNRRTLKDMLAVARLLLGFTEDMAQELVIRTQQKLEENPDAVSDFDSRPYSGGEFGGGDTQPTPALEGETIVPPATQQTPTGEAVLPSNPDTTPGGEAQ